MSAKAFKAESTEVQGMHSMDQSDSTAETVMRELKPQRCKELTTKCYQLKVHREKDVDFVKNDVRIHTYRTT